MKIERFDIGDTVLCDLCNKDWTDDEKSGGFLFVSMAICPDCADNFLRGVKKHNEEHYIRGICPKNKSFANWVREDIRGGKSGRVTLYYEED